MALLSGAYRLALWIAPVAFALGLVLLVQTISGVLRTTRRARLVTVPLAARQEMVLAEAGAVVLSMEGPLFTRLPQLTYELVGPDGASVRQRPILFRTGSSGFTRGKLQLRRFDVAVPGRHVLRVEGLGRNPREQECLLILERPHAAAVLGWILGIIGAAFVVIGSLVAFLLRLARVGLD